MSAVGIFSEQAANVADVISRSAAFQTETGAANAAAALAFCKRILERDVDDVRPKAVIGDPETIEVDRLGFTVAGSITVTFERDVEDEYRRYVEDGDGNIHPEGPNPLAAFDAMATWVAAVVAQAILEFRNGGNLIIQSVSRSKIGRSEVDEKDRGENFLDYMFQTVVLKFGSGGK